MQMIPVESSNIAAIGWHVGTLRVRFKDGAEYEYSGVTAEAHAALMAAPSKGRWLKEFRTGAKITPDNSASNEGKKPEAASDKFHTTQADGCCKIHLNNASLSGKLDKAKSFECPACGAEYFPRPYGPLFMWEAEAAFAVV